jgi:hypothetical protein
MPSVFQAVDACLNGVEAAVSGLAVGGYSAADRMHGLHNGSEDVPWQCRLIVPPVGDDFAPA